MSAGREIVDLLNRHGRRKFFSDLRRGRFNRLMWRDTFGRLLCWLSGEHIAIHQEFSNSEVFTSCRCCCRWLVQDRYKWKAKPWGK